MIEMSLTPEWRQAWNKMAAKSHLIDDFPDADLLDNDDYDALERLLYFLKALYDSTKFLEGPTATLERVLPTEEFLLEHFEKGKVG